MHFGIDLQVLTRISSSVVRSMSSNWSQEFGKRAAEEREVVWEDLTFLDFRILVTRHLRYTEKRPMSIFRMCDIRPKKNITI